MFRTEAQDLAGADPRDTHWAMARRDGRTCLTWRTVDGTAAGAAGGL